MSTETTSASLKATNALLGYVMKVSNGKADANRLNELLADLHKAFVQAPAAQRPTFKVHVAKMVESHQETYHVVLTNGLPRGEDSELDDAGTEGCGITPYVSENKSHADLEAAAWAEFLGVNPKSFRETKKGCNLE